MEDEGHPGPPIGYSYVGRSAKCRKVISEYSLNPGQGQGILIVFAPYGIAGRTCVNAIGSPFVIFVVIVIPVAQGPRPSDSTVSYSSPDSEALPTAAINSGDNSLFPPWAQALGGCGDTLNECPIGHTSARRRYLPR